MKRFRAVWAAFLIGLFLVFAAPLSVNAGSTRFELLASGAQTATAQGSAISVSGIREMTVYVSCTTSTAPTRLDVYLQTSSDGGTTWYDLTAQETILTNAAGTDITSTSVTKRNILDNQTCASAVKAIAKYTVFGDYVRAAWVISGTSFTFGVKAIGKN